MVQTALVVEKDHAMRPWADRTTFPSSALEYAADIILNMLIVLGTFGLLMLAVLLFG
jgi:hypothetical protein